MKYLPTRQLRFAQSQKPIGCLSKPRPLGLSISRYSSALAVCGALLAATGVQASGATYFWDPDAVETENNAFTGDGLGGTGLWDIAASSWWDGTAADSPWPNSALDEAVFSGVYTPGTLTPAAVTVSSGISANRLTFVRSGYTLSGGDVTLGGATPTVYVNLGETAVIETQLKGSDGLTIAGGGTVRLSNPTNSYTGTTTIANGYLVIRDEAALGTDTSAIVVQRANPYPGSIATYGFGGGSLVLDGASGGVTLTRDLSLQGRGPLGERGSAFISVGNNTVLGNISTGVPITGTAGINTRISSVNGTLTLAGGLNVGGTAGTTITSLGGVNTAGQNDFIITGPLTGTGTLEKSGAGTLFLTPSDTTGFTGRLRISGSNTGQQSSVRVSSANVFGTANDAGASGPIDLNGGNLEVRSDASLNIGKNVYSRSAGSIFTGPAVGGSAVNGTTTFGTLQQVVSTTGSTATTTFNSRNGFGITFTSMGIDASTSTSTLTNTLANNMAGVLTFTGNITLGEGSTASRPRVLAVGGNGTTVILGSVIAGTDPGKSITKTGNSSLTIRGTGTTVAGAVNINGGAIIATDFRSLNNNTATINIGTSTTAGALIIGTDAAATAAGLTTSKVINLAGTTGAVAIYASQPGSNPVVFNADFTATGAGAKTLTLGGSNTADNIINGSIPNNSATNTTALTKIGFGTWVLAGANGYTGTTTIDSGTLKILANGATSTVLPAGNAVTFNASINYDGGTLEVVGLPGVNVTQSLGALATSAGNGTIKLTAGAGGSVSLSFTGLTTSSVATLNIIAGASDSVAITGGNGLVSRTIYYNGADFALRDSNVLRAPIYGVDTNFVTSATALTAGTSVSNQITGSFATSATAISISTLKIAGSHTLTLGANLTLSAGGVLVDGGNAVIAGTGTLTLGSAALVVRANQATDTLRITAPISGTGGLTLSGAGTLILAGSNTGEGAVTINEGTLRLDTGGTLGAARSLTVRQAGTLDLNGITPTATINTFSNNGTITNSSATPVTLTVGGANGTGDSYGAIIGAINVTKTGTGTQNWLGQSTYTGVTNIGGGALVVVDFLTDGGSASGIGASSSAASNLVFSGTSAAGLSYRGSIINGNLTLGSTSASTDRLFTVTGAGVTLGSSQSTNINNAIVWSNTGAIVHGGTAQDRLFTFTGTSTGDNTFNPQLTDAPGFATSVTKTAAGQWNLGNTNNTYTGATTVNEGILAFNNAGALPANSPVVLAPTSATSVAVLQTSGVFDKALAATATAGAGTITWAGTIASTTGGAGFAAHTTELVVALGGIASPTPLTWGSGGFVGTSFDQNLVLNSTTALSSVDFRNAIDLGNAQRTINVLDNTATGADYAILSGDLSGTTGGLRKIGGGVLKLTGDNTYGGVTSVETGTLVVTSLGSSTDAPGTATSVGASGVAFGNGNAITLGNGGTTGAILLYAGPGEVSDRLIRLNTTTGANQIHADSAGPLILTNVRNDLGAGAKTLNLRGQGAAGNQITSQLSDNGGALSISVDGSATWILTNGANDYTGSTTAGAGALGIGHDHALGSSTLILNNGNVFAYGGDRTITNAVTLNNNTTAGFQGDYSLTFAGSANGLNLSANNITLNNNIVAGKALTFNGLTANALTANRAWTIDGAGTTVINGNFTTSTAFGVAITKNGDGTLVLGGSSTNNFNQNNAVTDVDRGTLRFAASNVFSSAPVAGSVAASGGLTLSPELATLDTAIVDLNGTTQTVNALTSSTDGVAIIDNTAAAPASFTFGANNSAVAFGTGTGSYTIQNSGGGALSIAKAGNTTATFGPGVVLNHTGATTSLGGGVFNIATPLNATASLHAIEASTLSATGGITNPGAVIAIEVGGGSTLGLLDGVGSTFANLTTLSLGNTGTGTATLNLNVGDGATDSFNLLTGGALNLGNTITFNLSDAGLSGNTTYTLLNVADGGLATFGIGNFILGNTPGGFTGFTWNVTDNLVQITTGNLITGNVYWRGATSTAWNGNANNWSTDKAGTTPSVSIPGAGQNVIFAYDGVGTGALTTTLEQNFKVNSLAFESGTTTPASVTINPGTNTTARLEVAPQVSTDGLKIAAGGPATVSINTAVRLGANQTWDVVPAASTLNLGPLQGEADVTKAGDGRVVLAQAADATFNTGGTTDITVTTGALELTNVGALGTLANNNVARVAVNGGVFYYNNATSGTLPNPITLGGGTLAAGSNTQTYSGLVTVTAPSTIALLDPTLGTPTGRSVTLSTGLAGTGDLTLDAVTTLGSGNAITGTLTLNQDNSAWSGNWNILRGSITTSNANGLGSGDTIDAEYGRILFTGTARTQQLDHDINIARSGGGAILELNTATGIELDVNGLVTLGGAGAGENGELRIGMGADNSLVRINGGIVLANDGRIGTQSAATRLLTVDSVISETGSGRTLRINDQTWGGTPGTVRLTGQNTFTGKIIVARGILEFDTVTDIGGGPSSLGQGSVIDVAAGANSTLRFIGDGLANSQTTNRPINITSDSSSNYSGTLDARGTNGASITFTGPITVSPNADGNWLTLTGAAGSKGFITGGVTMTGSSADLAVTGGNWTFSGSPIVIADDLLVAGADTVVNLNSVGVLSNPNPAGTSNAMYARAGATINLGVDGVSGVNNANGLDSILIGADSTVGFTSTLNTNGHDIAASRFDVGGIADGLTGAILGNGTITITYTGTDYANGLRFFRGNIEANLAGNTSILKQGLGDLTLSGDNHELTGTVATRIDHGNLILDYTTQNNSKLPVTAGLDLRGATVTINGKAGEATSQTVASTTLTNGGASKLVVNPGTGGTAVLNLNGVNRTAGTGTLRIELPGGTQNATNGVITDTINTNGILGTAAYATVKDASGTWFATNATNAADGNIVPLVSTAKNTVGDWVLGDHITDETTGFTGLVTTTSINSLRFNAAGGSALNIAAGSIFNIASGGILVTDQVAAPASIVGGALISGAADMIVTQDSSQTLTIGAGIRLNQALTKTGTGTLRLTGNNSYTGATQLQNGVLEVAGGNAIGDTSLVTLADDHFVTLRLLDDETIGALAGGSATTGLNALAMVDVGSQALTVNGISNQTYAGQFTGDGTLVKNGAGNMQLTNSSTGFTGTVIVNQGLFYLSGNGRIDASAFVINKGGVLMFDNNGSTRIGTRVLDDSPITLNSADGVFSGENIVRGLTFRTDQDSTTSNTETVGVLNLGSGASYSSLQQSGGNNSRAIIVASNIVRQNAATLDVRGRALGSNAGTGGQSQLRIVTGDVETAFINTSLVGGTGTVGGTAKDIKIVPWVIAENTAGAIAATNMGNSLATYVTGRGFIALDLTNEYATYATAGATNNTREVLAANLTGLAGRTLNSLVLHNNSIVADTAYAVTGTGAGQSLAVTSGALLFTLNPAAVAGNYGISLGGFDDGITVGGTNEYVFSVVNPSFATASVLTATVGSPLTSAADITKSGRGTLVLSGTNTAGGGTRKTTINEGILEISDLDNIGGDTGSLVFAGGTLRLGAGFTDDITTRSISFLQGGATIDTNGIELTPTHSLGSGIGGLTKAGAGTLTLNLPVGYSGPTTISGGTLAIGVDNATGLGRDLNIGAGATLYLGTYNIAPGLLTTSGAGPQIAGTGTINASSGFSFNHTGDTTIDAVLAGAGGLVKLQSNVVTLTGMNTFTGLVEVRAGGLSIDSIGNVGDGASALGAPTTEENGVIHLGLTTTAATLTYTGSGHSTDRIIALQGTTGGATINASGTGALMLGEIRGDFAGAKTLTLGGTSEAPIENTPGVIQNGMATLSVIKSGTNTWAFNETNSYTGTTSVNEGVLRLNVGQNLAGSLQFGSANTISTAGTLEVLADSSAPSLTAQTNSATQTNHLVIAPDKTLTINGNVIIGSSASASTTTLFDAAGGGSLVVNNLAASGTFRVGGYTGTSAGQGNVAVADLSGLASLAVTLDTATGVFRVNNTSTANTSGPYARLLLPTDTTVTASILAVGDGGQYNGTAGVVNRLEIGTGETVFNVNTVNIGTGIRDLGSITTQGPATKVTIRAADGASAVAFNMGTGSATTAAVLSGNQNTFDLTGTEADLKFSTVTIGNQNRGADLLNVFSFDAGLLEIGTLVASSRAANAFTTTTIINIGGGTVTTGAWTLASASGAGTAVATANFTGGEIVFSGNINRGTDSAGGGTATGTVYLAGANLDMSGNSIGTAANQIVFHAESGTLKNLGQLNGGAALHKTTPGTLILDGEGSAYTGATLVDEGTLIVAGSVNATASVNVASGATLGGNGVINTEAPVTVASGGTLSPGTSIGALTTGSASFASGSTFKLEIDTTAGTADLLGVVGDFSLAVTNDTLLTITDLTPAAITDGVYSFVFYTGSWNGGLFTYDGNTIVDGGSVTVGDNHFTLDYNYGGNSVALLAVPEPGTLLSMAGGLGMLLGLRRLRRRR